MAINIKELFVTDLDPNSGAWWSKDKVDKINYNFYLLSNGGMPGPQGIIGVDGGFGPVGAQGFTGYQGDQGYQGPQGAGSLNDWEYFPEDANGPGYLFPRKNPVNVNQSAPVALRIGYLSTDPEYFPVGAIPQEPAQIIKTSDSTWVNLRVECNNLLEGYNFSFKSSSGVGGLPRFEISPDITSNKFLINWIAQTIVLKTTSSIGVFNDSIVITDSLITINTGGISGPAFNLSNSAGKYTKSVNELRYTPGAATNKILVATNLQGDVEWKNIKDVFGTFPIGSIISIRPDEFISDNFWLNDSITVTAGSPLNNIYGRGKVGTDYEGWYLCNGETWETEQGFNQYLTPNLNNFSYTIDANGDAQNLVTIPETDPILIGGYDLRISAIPDANGIYNVGYTNTFLDNNSSPGNSVIPMETSGAYYTSQMIHIVYLEDTNLKWSNTGVYVPPITTTLITLTLPLASSTLCNEPVSTNYSWTGPNSANWNIFTVPSTTYKLFNSGTTNFAPAGWYINVDGYPIYWDGTNFTQRGITCTTAPPPNYTPNLTYSLLVDDLNGPVPGFGGDLMYLDIDGGTANLATATSLTWSDDQLTYPYGSNAPTGWYRDVNSGVRRYWNEGTGTFQGVSFTQDWVNRVRFEFGEFSPGYNVATGVVFDPGSGSTIGICSQDQDIHLTYVAGNDNLLNSTGIISQTQNVRNYQNNLGLYQNPPANGTCLYVPLAINSSAWQTPMIDIDGEVVNTPPLKEVHLQNRPFATNKYTKVYMDSADYGTISSTTGKIQNILSC